MRKMTREEADRFLREWARTGKGAVVRWHETIKARSIRREPRVSVCVDDEKPPFAYVRVDGVAELVVRIKPTRVVGVADVAG